MIKQFSLKNFKSFKSMDNLKLKNLTIIVGKNSCGKSSILQSLLLLKQTLNSQTNQPICLEGKYLKCSNLKEISFGLPAINTANIGYSFELKTPRMSGNLKIDFKNKKVADNYEIIIDKHIVRTETGENEKLCNFKKVTLNKAQKIIKKLQIKERPNKVNLIYNGFTPALLNIELSKDDGNNTNYLTLPPELVFEESQDVCVFLSETLRSMRYLSPVRAIPERAYVHYSHDVADLKEDGSNAAHLLWSKQNQSVSWRGAEKSLKNAVNDCLECMGLTQEITPDRIGDILYKVGIKEDITGKQVSLADVGFGYSQVIPVILLGLLNNKNNLMLIEQPEIHLHPSSAANLADLFLNFAEDDKRFVIETHSQELINRLRLRVIENPTLKDKINIVFVDKGDENGATIKQFEIDEHGMFPEWPDGFLDESEKLAQAILEARLSKY